MAYRVRWQLVGRSGQPLDHGCLGEGLCAYGDAVAAVAQFLRPYPDVCRCSLESYWLARRSREADLAVWVWIERQRIESRPGSAVRGWSETRQQIKLQCLCAIKKLSFQRGLVFHLTLNVRGYHIDTHRINR